MKRKEKASKPAAKSKPLPVEKTPIWQIYLAIAAIVIVYIALRLPGIDVPLDRDEGAFGYIGQMINRGLLPYRDVIDHKPPVGFYINALALHFIPATSRAIHIVLSLYNFATLLCLFCVAWLYFESLRAGLWSAFAYAVFSASPSMQGFTASTEMWGLLPLIASLLLAILGLRTRRLTLIFASGLAAAAACWTKQTQVASVLFVPLFIAFSIGLRGKAALLVRSVGMWILGVVTLSGCVVIYFYAHGALRDLIYWSVTYGFSYVETASIGKAGEFQGLAADVLRSELILWTVAIAAGIVGLIQRKS